MHRRSSGCRRRAPACARRRRPSASRSRSILPALRLVFLPVPVPDARRPARAARAARGRRAPRRSRHRDGSSPTGRSSRNAAEPGRLDGSPRHRLQRGENPGGRLVVDRHHHGGARREAWCGRGRSRGGASRASEAHERPREGECDPGEVDGEQRDQHPLQRGDAADRHDLVHLQAPQAVRQRARRRTRRPREPGRRAAARKRLARLALRECPTATGPAWTAALRAEARARLRAGRPDGVGRCVMVSIDRAMSR